jgi:hypothetical protein
VIDCASNGSVAATHDVGSVGLVEILSGEVVSSCQSSSRHSVADGHSTYWGFRSWIVVHAPAPPCGLPETVTPPSVTAAQKPAVGQESGSPVHMRLRQDLGAVDTEVITDREFTRLQVLLAERGVPGRTWTFANVWAAVSEWVLTASGDALSDEFMIGWQCSRNPNNPDGEGDHLPDPPEGAPDGPLFNVVFFWHFPNAGQVGVELWYSADAEWEAVTLDPDWDAEHLVNLHGWGFAGPRAAEFFAVVDASLQIDVASRKPPALLVVFRSGSREVVIPR